MAERAPSLWLDRRRGRTQVRSSQRLPTFSTAFCTDALEKLVPLPSHTNLTREQFSPASLGAEELVLR
jgi:hypothetical protein